MLSVKSSLFSLSIPQQQAVEAAKGAQERVLHGVPDDPQKTGISDTWIDNVFFSGKRQAAISQIRDLSYHTASLHLELEKPQGKRNQKRINDHCSEITENHKKLSGLMGGATLEFGTNGERAVVGRNSFLIHRSPSKLCPTGIALYRPELRGYKAIPTFNSAGDIGAQHIQRIRSSGNKSDQGIISCAGVLYKLQFDTKNMPSVLTDRRDDKWQALQFRLTSLWQANQNQIESTPFISTNPPIPSALPPAMGASSTPTPVPVIPTFESHKNIGIDQFRQIRAAGKLICEGKLYHVHFEMLHSEPVVFNDYSGHDLANVQLQLYKTWITYLTRRAIVHLNSIRPVDDALPLHTQFPDTESERFRIRAQLRLDQEWDAAASNAKAVFKKIIPLFQDEIAKHKRQISLTLNDLDAGKYNVKLQKKILDQAKSRLVALKVQQKNMNLNIADLKEINHNLFLIAKDSTSKEMQQIVLNRIKKFNKDLNAFAKSGMKGNAVDVLNVEMQNQTLFIKIFSAQLQQFQQFLLGPQAIMLADGSKATPPNQKTLTDLTEKLSEAASDPKTPWEKIEEAFGNLKNAQRRLGKLFERQLNQGLQLDRIIHTFKGKNGEGLSQVTGESFYTPKTYARIVTLKEIRAALLNRAVSLTGPEIENKVRECLLHIACIRTETEALNKYEKSDQFEGHRMYRPQESAVDGSHLNFSQWSDDMKRKLTS